MASAQIILYLRHYARRDKLSIKCLVRTDLLSPDLLITFDRFWLLGTRVLSLLVNVVGRRTNDVKGARHYCDGFRYERASHFPEKAPSDRDD